MRHHQHTAWAWLKAELVRQLGQDGSDALFAEYSRRALLDKQHNDRLDAPALIVKLESRMGRADAAEQRRLVKRIARLRALIDSQEEK